jgi:hypothetical protein
MAYMMRHVLGTKHKVQLRIPSEREVMTLSEVQTILTTVKAPAFLPTLSITLP